MYPDDAIEPLESAWAIPNGVLFRLRQGKLDTAALEELVELLRNIEAPDSVDTLPRRAVSLLWYMPLFVGWQKQRVEESGGNPVDVEHFATLMTNELERILGTP